MTVGVFTDADEIPKLQSLGKTRASHRDAPGHDLAKLDGVPTEYICSTVCAGDTACKGYVYRASTKTCWLKDGVPMRHDRANLVSAYVPWEAARNDRPRDKTFAHGKATGSLWKVENTGKTQDDAVRVCRDRCRSSSMCKAAIAERDTGRCRMFKNIDPSSIEQRPEYATDALFVRFDFKDGVRYVALKQGTEKAADQAGNDLRMQTIEHPDLCRAVCALERSCSALTMNNAWTGQAHKNECYLKSRARNPTSVANNYVETSWLAGDDR